MAFAVTVLVGGCGISLDVDPRPPEPTRGSADSSRSDAGGGRDAGTIGGDAGGGMDAGGISMDAGLVRPEAGLLDAFVPPPRDASPAVEAGVTVAEGGAAVRDGGGLDGGDGGGLRDAGAARVCGPGAPCATGTTFCLATAAGTCGTGTCAPRTPCGTPTGVSTVCGCDGVLYDTTPLAYCAGTDARRPPATCCFTTADCTAIGIMGRCVGADCAGGHAGTCRGPAVGGGCWDAFDCAATEMCSAATCNCDSCPTMPGACGAG